MSKGHSMNLRTIESLLEVHKMIEKKHTGGLYSFARKLGLGPTTLQRRLDTLKDLGADISFNRSLRTYMYENNFRMIFEIKAD